MTSIRRRLDDAGTMGFLVVVASAALLAVIAMVEALVRGLDEHGWDPETVPVFTAPEPDQVFDQEQRSYDHDDPTSSLVEEQS